MYPVYINVKSGLINTPLLINFLLPPKNAIKKQVVPQD